MASFDDLGRALREDAADNAPPASAIDVDAVVTAARARRRPRQWAVGTLGLVAVLGFGGLAVTAVTPPTFIAAGESADTADLESRGSDELGAPEAEGGSPLRSVELPLCGAPAPAPDQGPIGLALEVQVQSDAAAGGPVTGTARVVNTGDEPRTVITRSAAWAWVLQNGVVVGGPSIVGDAARTTVLNPGVSLDLPLSAPTQSCVDGAALAPGDYTVLVIVDTRRSFDEPESLVVGPEQPLRLP